MGKFELGPTSVRELGPTASLTDRFAPRADHGYIHRLYKAGLLITRLLPI